MDPCGLDVAAEIEVSMTKRKQTLTGDPQATSKKLKTSTPSQLAKRCKKSGAKQTTARQAADQENLPPAETCPVIKLRKLGGEHSLSR